jgi:manganese/iron transport system ATP-binding protein/manganese/zinc/iron transport system ATP- binding protein
MLEVHGGSAGYGGSEPALREVDFAVAGGQLVSVLGPNGGGKTTLFRALLDEAPQRSGEMVLRDRAAYVPQTERSRLDFPVDALGVVLMGTYSSLPWHRRVGAEQREVARSSLARVGLSGSEATAYGALSGGQRQRVLIARALAQRARILLFDEPLSGVDAPSAERILEVLAELRDAGCALLVTTHDIGQAREADLVLCLNRTQIAFGPPAETLTPRTLARTYGSELIVLPDGGRAVVVQHHAH